MHLAQYDIPVVADLAGVGQNLQITTKSSVVFDEGPFGLFRRRTQGSS